MIIRSSCGPVIVVLVIAIQAVVVVSHVQGQGGDQGDAFRDDHVLLCGGDHDDDTRREQEDLGWSMFWRLLGHTFTVYIHKS